MIPGFGEKILRTDNDVWCTWHDHLASWWECDDTRRPPERRQHAVAVKVYIVQEERGA